MNDDPIAQAGDNPYPPAGCSATFMDEEAALDTEKRSKRDFSSKSWKKMSIKTSDDAIKKQEEDDNSRTQRDIHCTSILVSLLVFLVMVTAGALLTMMHAQSVDQKESSTALVLATETTEWFINSMDKALTPLFSLAQFATELELFRDLPNQIGPSFQNGSLPFLPPPPGRNYSHRNISGSPCTSPQVLNRYNDIAATIMENAVVEKGVLMQLYMMPETVTCMVHPLVQTLVNEQGQEVIMDGTNQLGLDMIADEQLTYHAEKTLKSEDLVVVGPITLRHCMDEDCNNTVEKAIVARLPVKVPDHSIAIPRTGEVIENRWGMVVATINWKALVDQSGMDQRFASMGREFSLKKKDRLYGKDDEMVLLAQSPGFQEGGKGNFKNVHTTVLTSNQEEWTMVVQYKNSSSDSAFQAWLLVAVVFVSSVVAGLLYTILQQKQDMVAKTKTQEARVETERNMTAYFAHELRNPLGAIESALCAMPDNLPNEVQEIHSGMRLCSSFMVRIMNNLCDVRQLEEGRMAFHVSHMELDKLMKETHGMLLPSVNAGVELKYEIHPNVTPKNNCVMGDLHRITQILTNVTSNAIKYTASGSITLSVKWEDDGRRVRFECADTGPGIPKAEQGQLFKRFVKRGGAPGSGLGLAISKHIVDSMNGHIYFESNPVVAPGTKCIVLLPLEPCEAPTLTPANNSNPLPDDTTTASVSKASTATTLEQQSPIEDPLSILIVDDIKVNRLMLRKRIKKAVVPNAEIVEAQTGEEALEIVKNRASSSVESGQQQNDFQVIIMDQYMESAGGALLGTDAVIALRRMGCTSMIIGSSGNDINDQFSEAGADCVWQKPLPSNVAMIEELRQGLGL